MMNGHPWSVSIFTGDMTADTTLAPVKRRDVVVAGEIISQVESMLIYEPVDLWTIGVDGSVVIRTHGGLGEIDHREIYAHVWSFDGPSIRLQGYEAREDGVMVKAIWHVSPYGGE